MQSEQLLQQLIAQNQDITERITPLRTLPPEALRWRSTPSSWNILECLEHLNRYGDFYLPAIEQRIQKSTTAPVPTFKSGFLGSYFAKSMLPQEGKELNKMSTFKDKNPLNAPLDETVLDTFLAQQESLLRLLHLAKRVNLNAVKIPISITRFITLKLGDAFLFFINHIERHTQQIERIQSDFHAQN